MSRVTASTDIQNVKPEDVPKFTELALEDVVKAINGGISFSDNIDCKIVPITFGAANTQQAVGHGLGRVPSGYLVVSSNVATSVYNGSSGSSTSQIYLQSSLPATVSLLFF